MKLVLTTRDEEYGAPARLGERIQQFLYKHVADTYNREYVVTVTVDVVGKEDKHTTELDDDIPF